MLRFSTRKSGFRSGICRKKRNRLRRKKWMLFLEKEGIHFFDYSMNFRTFSDESDKKSGLSL